MQLVQEVTPDLLESYQGGEIIIGNVDPTAAATLVRGTLVDVRTAGDDWLAVTFRCEEWSSGRLDDNVQHTWSASTSPSPSAVLLSSTVSVDEEETLHFAPSLKGTVATMKPRTTSS